MTATATENGTIFPRSGEHGKVEFIDGDGRQRLLAVRRRQAFTVCVCNYGCFRLP